MQSWLFVCLTWGRPLGKVGWVLVFALMTLVLLNVGRRVNVVSSSLTMDCVAMMLCWLSLTTAVFSTKTLLLCGIRQTGIWGRSSWIGCDRAMLG